MDRWSGVFPNFERATLFFSHGSFCQTHAAAGSHPSHLPDQYITPVRRSGAAADWRGPALKVHPITRCALPTIPSMTPSSSPWDAVIVDYTCTSVRRIHCLPTWFDATVYSSTRRSTLFRARYDDERFGRLLHRTGYDSTHRFSTCALPLTFKDS